METRILFNGRQYTGVESMPPDVRKAYDELMAQFVDADHDGIPDILERGAAGNVIAVQHASFTVNGRSFGSPDEMPEALRRLCEEAVSLAGEASGPLPTSPLGAAGGGLPGTTRRAPAAPAGAAEPGQLPRLRGVPALPHPELPPPRAGRPRAGRPGAPPAVTIAPPGGARCPCR